MTQERMIYAKTPKVDTEAKADAPGASNAFKIDTTKINVNMGKGKPCTVVIELY